MPSLCDPEALLPLCVEHGLGTGGPILGLHLTACFLKGKTKRDFVG